MIADNAMNAQVKVRDFQNRLYLTAKADRKSKFYEMYDKIYREDILKEAWKRVKANGGAGGIDKVSIEDVKSYGENKLLGEIAEELRTEKYRCKPVKRTYIPKSDGRKRSGTNTKHREEFNRMIEDCMQGKIDMIITKSISRFARNTLDCLKYIRQLMDKNIPVYFEKENINTLDSKGEIMLTIMASLAQQESQSLSKT